MDHLRLSRRMLALAGVAAICVQSAGAAHRTSPAFVHTGGGLLNMNRDTSACTKRRFCESRGLGSPLLRTYEDRVGRAAKGVQSSFRMTLSEAEERPSGVKSVTMSEGTHDTDGFRCYYAVAQPEDVDPSVPPLILVHGFGINSKHWNKNMAEIATAIKAPVYAVDLLGFGKSQKPSGIQYGQALWAWQVQNLIVDVIKAKRVFLAGNSVGAFVAMHVAQLNQNRVAGLCVINPAGRFGVLNPVGFDIPIIGGLLRNTELSRWLGGMLFDNIRAPEKVRSTLEQVYSDKRAITQDLIDSIIEPSLSNEALACGPDLFGSLLSAAQDKGWEELLKHEELGYAGPLLGLWGDEDPWIVPMYGEILKDIRPDMELHWIKAGHCPHDERPEEANKYISEWITRLAANPPDFPVSFIPRYQKLPLNLKSLF